MSFFEHQKCCQRSLSWLLVAFIVLGSCGCRHSHPGLEGALPIPNIDRQTLYLEQTTKPEPSSDSGRVLVVENSNSPESIEIARYYVEKRHIPAENLLVLKCSARSDISPDDFRRDLEDPIRRAIFASKNAIDFIVTTKGIPLRFNPFFAYSVDAGIAAMDLTAEPITKPTEASIRAVQSPYFGSTERFTHAKFGMYLVTRLDGYSVASAKRLVDNSLAAKPSKGLFYLQTSANRGTETFGELQSTMLNAQAYLSRLGFDARLGPKFGFQVPDEPLMGYVTWGSNGAHYSKEVQDKVRFLPGAVAETYVSTSARTFAYDMPGQSKIADLIEQGVTGVKGYVSEPFTFALCKADLLLARYTSGFNLAESFYAASPTIKWKDVVIGDPLCNPYAPSEGQ